MSLPPAIAAARKQMQAYMGVYDWDSVSERRMDILKVFLRLAAAQGYSALTMRGLATELNLKAPSIYSHFPDGKEEIIAHSLRWQASLFARAILDATNEATTADDFLIAVARAHCRMNLENRENNLWDMIVASDRVGKFLPIDLRDEMHEWIRLCGLQYQAAAESLGHDDCALKARQALSAIDAVHGWATWDGSDADLSRIQDEAVNLCHAIMAAPATMRSLNAAAMSA